MRLPCVGYRYWWLTDGQLRSWVAPASRWNLDGVTEAIHITALDVAALEPLPPHQSPGDEPDMCGLYGFKSLWGAEHWITNYRRIPQRATTEPYTASVPLPVCGLIVGAGDICVHGDEGWRASRAQVLALGYSPTPGPQLRALSEQHAIPLIHLSNLERYADEWGERL